MRDLRTIFSFPDQVNEKAARSVAGLVLVTTIATLALSIAVGTGWLWLSAALAAGFLARVLTGPTLSPFGQLATRVLAPRLGPAVSVPGPPKRFAQAMGFVMTAAAAMLTAVGGVLAAQVLLAVLVVASGLESIVGYCLGCTVFAFGMRLGVIPESACAQCADVPGHLRTHAAGSTW